MLIAFCLLLAGCTGSQTYDGENAVHADNTNPTVAEKCDPVNTEHTEGAHTIIPLPDTTMENLTDAILSVSLDEGNAYVDDNGHIQMDRKIYIR